MDLTTRFKDANGEWLDADRWPTVQRIATCRTADCQAKGLALRVTLQENVDGILRAMCAGCGQAPELREVP